MRRRVSAMEDYIQERVEERLVQEIDAIFASLERGLSREEFKKALVAMVNWQEERQSGT